MAFIDTLSRTADMYTWEHIDYGGVSPTYDHTFSLNKFLCLDHFLFMMMEFELYAYPRFLSKKKKKNCMHILGFLLKNCMHMGKKKKYSRISRNY